MDDIPVRPAWRPQMPWKIHFPRPGPGPGPGPINPPPAIDDMMAALAMHSLSEMLLDKPAADDVRPETETTPAETALAETARSPNRPDPTAGGAAAGNGSEPRLG